MSARRAVGRLRVEPASRVGVLLLIAVLCAAALLAPTHTAWAATQPPDATAATASADQAPEMSASQPVPLPGADPVLDERVKGVAKLLRCPVCQGESIQDSPADLATQMKTLVRERLANGQSEQQVLDYFVAKYGQWILLEPRAEGINLLVYWLPVAFLVLGAGLIVVVVKKWTRPVVSPEL